MYVVSVRARVCQRQGPPARRGSRGPAGPMSARRPGGGRGGGAGALRMEARAARRAQSALALLPGGGAATGPGPGPGAGAAGGGGGARGWDASGAPWRRRWRRRRRLRGDELAPRPGEPVEPGGRAEAAAQAERPEPERRAPTMAAQGEPGYLAAQSDPGSNSERSTDSPVPGSEDDLVAGAPLHSPEWSEERFRVDRKKLEAMLQGRHPPAFSDPRPSPPLLPAPAPATPGHSRRSSPVPSPAGPEDTQGVEPSRGSPPFHASPVYRHREPRADLTLFREAEGRVCTGAPKLRSGLRRCQLLSGHLGCAIRSHWDRTKYA